jgi:FAD/FMN-containing dehydrogenase
MDEGLNAKVLVMPASTEELSEIMKIMYRYDQTVVVHGGLTNLVGSTETSNEDVVISLEKMNKIEELDEKGRTITVQAGVILQNVQEAAKERNLLFPLNFGAKGSAQMGGVISTNAGGLRVFRFGMTRNLVLGLEVVLADGTVISSLKKIIKDNSAYDLKHLFIGSEGTLAIITRAVLKLIERPKSRCSAFLATNSYSSIVDLYKFLDRELIAKLSGFELIWKETYMASTSERSGVRPPLPHDYNYYILVELMGGDPKGDFESLQSSVESALINGMVEDAVLAFTESDLEWFWKIREDVHAFVSLCTYDQHFDISLPMPLIGEYVDQVINQLKLNEEIEQIFPFGHIADGNVHFVIDKKNNAEELTDWINDVIYNPLRELMGSVSAEHGIGLHKKKYLDLCRTEEEIELMKQIKLSLDPKRILNRGKVLDL